MAPRSSATTLSPASASSLERIPPVQPRPTTTTSTSLSFVTMVPSRSAHVRYADRVIGKRLVAELHHVLAMHRDRAWEAEHAPGGLVAVAAIDRVAEHAFHYGLVDGAPEHAHRRPVLECDLALRQFDEHLLALGFVDLVEGFAKGLTAMRIRRCDTGPIEVRGGE